MGTHPIFESDFDCLTESRNKTVKMVKSKMSKHQKINEDGVRVWIKTGNKVGREKMGEGTQPYVPRPRVAVAQPRLQRWQRRRSQRKKRTKTRTPKPPRLKSNSFRLIFTISDLQNVTALYLPYAPSITQPFMLQIFS